jgi:carboxyl-terminal processing protease
MRPMLTTLAPLLGDGTLFSFMDRSGARSVVALRDGHLLYDGQPMSGEVNPLRLNHGLPPVALLTSQRTASSAEATLVAFRGLTRAATFGQATAGAATGNMVFPLADGAQLLITTDRDVDRTGHVYGNHPIPPDHPTPDGATPDTAVAAATGWLQTQPGCTPR